MFFFLIQIYFSSHSVYTQIDWMNVSFVMCYFEIATKAIQEPWSHWLHMTDQFYIYT